MRLCTLIVASLVLTTTAQAALIRVGPNQRLTRIGDAARIAQDGDTIEIAPATYRADVAVWTQDALTIRGTGPGVVLDAHGRSAEGKAIWVVRGGKIRIENIHFRGARVPDGNGAGIRFERGELIVRHCQFTNNEMGILTGNTADTRLRIENSVFARAPHHPGNLHHLLYVGRIGAFHIEGSRLSGGYRGHLLKSRARESTIIYNLLDDGTDGQASYELEFPDSGIARVVGNVIGQSAHTDNNILIRYGAEGAIWPENRLSIIHNTLISRHNLGQLIRVDGHAPHTPHVRIEANLLIGSHRIDTGPYAVVRDNRFAPRLPLSAPATSLDAYWFDHIPPLPVRAGTDNNVERQIEAPIGTRPIPVNTPQRAGALQRPPR